MTQTTTTKKYAYQKARGFMAEQLKQVNDRPSMPGALCLKLVQSLIDDCVPYDAKIGVVDSTPILALHLKEAGFTNLTLLNNKEAKYHKTSARVWLDDVKGFCTNNKIKTLGFSPNMTKTPKFDIIIGNPPYGSGASLAVKFLNKSFELTDDVYFVLPASIEKPSLLNRVNTSFDVAHSEKLPNDTFPRNIQTVYQHWSKATTPRLKIKTLRSHPDLKFVSKEEANVGIGRVGNGGAGYVMLEKFSHLSPNSNYFLKVSDATAARLKQMQPELVSATLESFNSNPSLSKHQLISIYKKHFS